MPLPESDRPNPARHPIKERGRPAPDQAPRSPTFDPPQAAANDTLRRAGVRGVGNGVRREWRLVREPLIKSAPRKSDPIFTIEIPFRQNQNRFYAILEIRNPRKITNPD